MRVLLASGAAYLPPRGGSTRSNRAWLERLAKRGHSVAVIAPAVTGTVPGELSGQSIDLAQLQLQENASFSRYEWNGVTVDCVRDPARIEAHLTTRIREFEPDWVLVSSEDLGQRLLRTASDIARGRVVYLAHTPQMLPFGPASLNPSAAGAALVRDCAAVIAISRWVAGCIRESIGAEAHIVHPPVYRRPATHADPEFDAGLINPCEVKGLSVFLDIARALPNRRFAALTGWGATSVDLQRLRAHHNIVTLEPCRDIAEFFCRVRVLLVPSLWPEGFGLVATEAMLHGVPVIASNLGGLPEAKLGTPGVLPVRPIERYQARFEENLLPVPIVPDQDVEPWVRLLEEWLTNDAEYTEQKHAARAAADAFVEAVEPDALEALLGGLRPSDRPPVAPDSPPPQTSRLEQLSPERRALLARLARSKQLR